MQVWRSDRLRQIAEMYNLCPDCRNGCKHWLWLNRAKHKHDSLAILEPYLSSHDKGLWIIHGVRHFDCDRDMRAPGERAPFRRLPVRPGCVSLCVWNPLPSVNTMCAYTNWASIQKCLFLCTVLCCVCVYNVCACLSVANYPSYKYKIPIRHWVSGWLQRRHNWFQMVTQIFLSRLQHHHTGCVWEKATGESEVESGKKEEWQEWINTEGAQE